MSHLPECWLSEGNFDAVCMCDRLRTCEQRVEEAMDRAWTQTVALAVAHTRTATLDAAREAVAGIQDGPKNQPYWIDREAALTAIDALRIDTPKQQVMEHINLAVVEDA